MSANLRLVPLTKAGPISVIQRQATVFASVVGVSFRLLAVTTIVPVVLLSGFTFWMSLSCLNSLRTLADRLAGSGGREN